MHVHAMHAPAAYCSKRFSVSFSDAACDDFREHRSTEFRDPRRVKKRRRLL